MLLKINIIYINYNKYINYQIKYSIFKINNKFKFYLKIITILCYMIIKTLQIY